MSAPTYKIAVFYGGKSLVLSNGAHQADIVGDPQSDPLAAARSVVEGVLQEGKYYLAVWVDGVRRHPSPEFVVAASAHGPNPTVEEVEDADSPPEQTVTIEVEGRKPVVVLSPKGDSAQYAYRLAKSQVADCPHAKVKIETPGKPAVEFTAAVKAGSKTLKITEGGTADNPKIYDAKDYPDTQRIESLKAASHIVIRGFRLKRPDSPHRMAGLLMLGEWQDVTVEDCTFVGFDDNLNIQGDYKTGAKATGLLLDRVVATGSRQSDKGHSQGLYMSKVNGAQLRHCVLDDNGKPGSQFDHDMYTQFDCGPIDTFECYFGDAAATGSMIRSGGKARRNIYGKNPIGGIGGVNYSEFIDCVVLEGQSADYDGERNWGLRLHPCMGGVISGNIIANLDGRPENARGITLDKPKADSGFPDHREQLGDKQKPITVTGNYVYAWGELENGIEIHPDHGQSDVRDDNYVTADRYPRKLEKVPIPAELPALVSHLRMEDAGGPPNGKPAPVVTQTAAAPTQAAAATVSAPKATGGYTLTGFNPNPKYRGKPVLVRLHGKGGGVGGRADLELTSPDGRKLTAMVSFDGKTLEIWMWDPTAVTAWLDQDLMLEMVKRVEAEAGTAGRYIYGISMGGGGAFRLAKRAHAEGMPFDAVRMDTPALLHSTHTDHFANTSHGTGQSGKQRADVDPDGLNFDGAAFKSAHITLGGKDTDVSPESARELARVIESKGGKVNLWEDPEGGHQCWKNAPPSFTQAWESEYRS